MLVLGDCGKNGFVSVPGAASRTLRDEIETSGGTLVSAQIVAYLTRASFMRRPETFQSWMYRLPSASQ